MRPDPHQSSSPLLGDPIKVDITLCVFSQNKLNYHPVKQRDDYYLRWKTPGQYRFGRLLYLSFLNITEESSQSNLSLHQMLSQDP